MIRTSIVLAIVVISSTVMAADAVLIGGYFPIKNKSISEYFVYVTAIDGNKTKNVNINTRTQIEQIEAGEHLLNLTCGYKFNGRRYASTPQIKALFKGGMNYELIGSIILPSDRNKDNTYCDVKIVESNG